MSATKKREESNGAARGNPSALAERQVFLLTVYTPRNPADAGVYLQASHEASTRKFADLASTFAFLETLTQVYPKSEV